MKKTIYAIFALSAVALTVAAAPIRAGNASATGDYVRSNGTHMIFNAIKHKDGTTTGSLLSESVSGFITIVSYNDIAFSADGKSAYLHGIVTYATNPALIGNESIQKVTDNGEGGHSTPDAVTSVRSLPGIWTFPGSIPLLDAQVQIGIVSGNIQVRAQ